jgi:hypothetical protein
LYALGNRGALVRRRMGDWVAHGLLFKLKTACFRNSFLHFNAVIKIVLNDGVEASKINHFLLLVIRGRCCNRGIGWWRIPTSLEVRPLTLKFVKLLEGPLELHFKEFDLFAGLAGWGHHLSDIAATTRGWPLSQIASSSVVIVLNLILRALFDLAEAAFIVSS